MNRDVVPRRSFRFLTHPFEIAFGCLFSIIGTSLALYGAHDLTTVQRLPAVLVWGWTIALLLGGPAIMAGLFWPGRESLGRAIERAGLYLGASAWITYGIAVLSLTTSGRALVPTLQGLTIALACVGRARALTKVDRVVQRIADVKRREPDRDEP